MDGLWWNIQKKWMRTGGTSILETISESAIFWSPRSYRSEARSRNWRLWGSPPRPVGNSMGNPPKTWWKTCWTCIFIINGLTPRCRRPAFWGFGIADHWENIRVITLNSIWGYPTIDYSVMRILQLQGLYDKICFITICCTILVTILFTILEALLFL